VVENLVMGEGLKRAFAACKASRVNPKGKPMTIQQTITPDYVLDFFKRRCPALRIADEEAQLEGFKLATKYVGGDLDVDVLIPADRDQDYIDMKLDALAKHLQKRIEAAPGSVFAVTQPAVTFSMPEDRPVRRCTVDMSLWEKAA
jgi:hypothetical protein